MDISSSCYKYKFVTKINSGVGYPTPELFYTFQSAKTNKTYHVHIEIHPNNFYGVKFHLKDHKKNPNKYNIQTNLHEARPVIFTCIKIMLEIGEKDRQSSFGFIGSNTLFTRSIRDKREIYEKTDEPKNNTKRFSVYKKILLSLFSCNTFEHIQNKEYSAYMLIRQTELEKSPNLVSLVSAYFSDNYSNFD